MTVQTDPIDPCWVDESEAAQVSLPLPESVSGFGSGQEFRHDKANTIFRSAAAWKVWHDGTKLPIPEAITAGSCRLGPAFAYTTLGGLTESLVDETSLVVLGRYVSMTDARITARGQADLISYTFTATKDHHFYISADGLIEVDIVTVGDPAAPGAGQVLLHTVETNATDIVGQTEGPLFAERRLVVENAWAFEDALRISDTGSGAILELGNLEDGEGFEFRALAGGTGGQIFEYNGLNQVVVDFGSAGVPMEIARDLQIIGSFEVDDDVTIGDGKTETASTPGWYRVGTHYAADANADTWGAVHATKTVKDQAQSTTATVLSPGLEDGIYTGRVTVVGTRSNGPLSTAAAITYEIVARVSGGTATQVNSSFVFYHDTIGLSSVTYGGSSNSLTVAIAIPAVGFNTNYTVRWDLTRSDDSL